jgi:hypothetical protein
MGPHTRQRPPAEVESEAHKYMAYMHRIVLGGNRDRHFILNMDQTLVYFLMCAKRTLEVIGKKHSIFAQRHITISVQPLR